MNRILVVGGAGYIGGYLVDVLRKKSECEVTVFDSLLYESRYLKDVDFIFGDIRDTTLLKKTLKSFDTVIWLAALVGDGACQVDVELTHEVNTNSVKWLADNFSGKIVFTSTCSIYGVNHELISEDAKPNPLSAYASSKLEAEQYLFNTHKDSLIFRLGTLFGLGDTYSRVRLDLVLNVLIQRASAGKPLDVFGGDQWRPLLHVKDVAHAVEYCLDGKVSGLYNLSACNMRIRDMAEAIKAAIPNTSIRYESIKFEDMRNYRVSTERILAQGWRPKFSINDGIAEMQKVFSEKRLINENDPVYSNVAYLKSIYNAEGGK